MGGSRRSGFRNAVFGVLLLSCVADGAVFFRRKRPEYVHANFSVTAISFTKVRGILVICLLDTLRQKLLFADDETSVECAQPSFWRVFVWCLSWIMHLSRIT
uniref:Putative secreted protein n=1 Tax=Ixodes ricinus TaxID=34613 RepID=A0A6B0UH97_IXORI